jgi:oxygen-independent coproporphyrinogen-3 oxidase
LFSDSLAVAQRTGTLARNFQGYTTDTAGGLIGFGASAISSLPQGYLQNATAVPDYRRSIMKGELATARGRLLTGEDRFRGAIIERLMCDLYVDLDEICARYGRKADSLRTELKILRELASDGLVVVDGNCLFVPERMRAGVRLVCAVFDTYLRAEEARHAAAV